MNNFAIKRHLQLYINTLGYQIESKTPTRKQYPDATDEEWDAITKVRPFTMTSPERILAAIRAASHLVKHQLLGDIVECGVWRGGSSMAIAMTLLRLHDLSRKIFCYDTFEGMTEPTARDIDLLDSQPASLLLAEAKQRGQMNHGVCAVAPLDEVKNNMQSLGYPAGKIALIKGPVEQTIPATMPEKISLLRLDTDWYESTKHELIHLYPRLVPGGILIIDDYGHWGGAKQAVDEYFLTHPDPIFLNRIDYSGRLGVKPFDRNRERSASTNPNANPETFNRPNGTL